MISLRISNIATGSTIAVFKKFINFRFTKVLSASGVGQFEMGCNCNKLPTAGLYAIRLQRAEIVWSAPGIGGVVVRSGFVSDVRYLFNERVVIELIDWVGYMNFRFLRQEFNLGGTGSVKAQTIFDHVNATNQALNFTVGTLNHTTTETLKLSENTSMYDAMSKIIANGGEFRVVDDQLDVALGQTGDTLQGVFKFNAKTPSTSNIVDGDWLLFTVDDFYNVIISRDKNASTVETVDGSSIADTLIIERFSYDPQGVVTATNGGGINYPNIEINAGKEERWNINVGDRKQIYIGIDKIGIPSFDYLGVVKKVDIRGVGGRVQVNIEIGEQEVQEYGQRTLDGILGNFGKRVRDLEVNSL